MSPRSSLAYPPVDLSGFPVYHLRPTDTVARIHRADRQACFYSSDGSGRFDLVEPLGTCYVGDDPLASFVEVFREAAVVAESLVMTKELSVLRSRGVGRLADVAHPGSRRFGITGEIHTTTDYQATQAWAEAFQRSDFDGVRYRVRHDPAQDLIGFALFGSAGVHDDAALITVTRSLIPASLVASAWDRFGIMVLPT